MKTLNELTGIDYTVHFERSKEAPENHMSLTFSCPESVDAPVGHGYVYYAVNAWEIPEEMKNEPMPESSYSYRIHISDAMFADPVNQDKESLYARHGRDALRDAAYYDALLYLANGGNDIEPKLSAWSREVLDALAQIDALMQSETQSGIVRDTKGREHLFYFDSERGLLVNQTDYTLNGRTFKSPADAAQFCVGFDHFEKVRELHEEEIYQHFKNHIVPIQVLLSQSGNEGVTNDDFKELMNYDSMHLNVFGTANLRADGVICKYDNCHERYCREYGTSPFAFDFVAPVSLEREGSNLVQTCDFDLDYLKNAFLRAFEQVKDDDRLINFPYVTPNDLKRFDVTCKVSFPAVWLEDLNADLPDESPEVEITFRSKEYDVDFSFRETLSRVNAFRALEMCKDSAFDFAAVGLIRDIHEAEKSAKKETRGEHELV